MGYSYDKKTKRYRRSMPWGPHVLADGTQVSTDNVLVIKAKQHYGKIFRGGGHDEPLHDIINAKGTFYYFNRGRYVKGTWRKGKVAEPFTSPSPTETVQDGARPDLRRTPRHPRQGSHQGLTRQLLRHGDAQAAAGGAYRDKTLSAPAIIRAASGSSTSRAAAVATVWSTPLLVAQSNQESQTSTIPVANATIGASPCPQPGTGPCRLPHPRPCRRCESQWAKSRPRSNRARPCGRAPSGSSSRGSCAR